MSDQKGRGQDYQPENKRSGTGDPKPHRILSGKGGRRKLDRNSGGTVDGGESAENRRSGRGILDGR